MDLVKIVADAGPAITDINTGVWSSVIMLLLMGAVALLLFSFYRRYKKASRGLEDNNSDNENK
jgi:hypothetical protein